MLHYAIIIALTASGLAFAGVGGMSARFGWSFAALALVILAVTRIHGRPHAYFAPGSTSAPAVSLWDRKKKPQRRA